MKSRPRASPRSLIARWSITSCTVARFIETGDMDAVTSHVNYSGRVLEADEEFDREE